MLPSVSENSPSDRLARLGEQLDKARAQHRRPGQTGGSPGLQQGLAFGFRIGIELVTAVLVAGGVGWALDRWLGTRPWVMLTMVILGIAAGMLTVYRATAGLGTTMSHPRSGAGNGGLTTGKPGDDRDN